MTEDNAIRFKSLKGNENNKYVLRFEDKTCGTVSYSYGMETADEAVYLAKRICQVWFTPEEWKTKRLTVEYLGEVCKILWDSEAAA